MEGSPEAATQIPLLWTGERRSRFDSIDHPSRLNLRAGTHPAFAGFSLITWSLLYSACSPDAFRRRLRRRMWERVRRDNRAGGSLEAAAQSKR